jgi:hypothetical protein
MFLKFDIFVVFEWIPFIEAGERILCLFIILGDSVQCVNSFAFAAQYKLMRNSTVRILTSVFTYCQKTIQNRHRVPALVRYVTVEHSAVLKKRTTVLNRIKQFGNVKYVLLCTVGYLFIIWTTYYFMYYL